MTIFQRVQTETSQFELIKQIGEGRIGVVWSGRRADAPDQLFAIKFPKDSTFAQAQEREYKNVIEPMRDVLRTQGRRNFEGYDFGHAAGSPDHVAIIMPFYDTRLQAYYNDLRQKSESPVNLERYAVDGALEYIAVIKALHEIGKTCLDRKIDDLYVVGDCIEVTDWNVVRDDAREENLKSEVTLWAQLWFELLTGRFPALPLAYRMDDHWRRQDDRNEQEKARHVSLGLRLILWNALHQLGNRSYADLETVEKDLLRWRAYLTKTPQDISMLLRQDDILQDIPGSLWTAEDEFLEGANDVRRTINAEQKVILQDLLWRMSGDEQLWDERQGAIERIDNAAADILKDLHRQVRLMRSEEIPMLVSQLREQSWMCNHKFLADLDRWERVAAIVSSIAEIYPERTRFNDVLVDLERSIALDDLNVLDEHQKFLMGFKQYAHGQAAEALDLLLSEIEIRQLLRQSLNELEPIEGRLDILRTVRGKVSDHPWVGGALSLVLDIEDYINNLARLIGGQKLSEGSDSRITELLMENKNNLARIEDAIQEHRILMPQLVGEQELTHIHQWAESRMALARFFDRYWNHHHDLRQWHNLFAEARRLKSAFEDANMAERYRNLFAEGWSLLMMKSSNPHALEREHALYLLDALRNDYVNNPLLEQEEYGYFSTTASEVERLKGELEGALKGGRQALGQLAVNPIEALNIAQAHNLNILSDPEAEAGLNELTRADRAADSIDQTLTGKIADIRARIGGEVTTLNTDLHSHLNSVNDALTSNVRKAKAEYLETRFLNAVRQAYHELYQFESEKAAATIKEIYPFAQQYRESGYNAVRAAELDTYLEALELEAKEYRDSRETLKDMHIQSQPDFKPLTEVELKRFRAEVNQGKRLEPGNRQRIAHALRYLEQTETRWIQLARLFDDDSALNIQHAEYADGTLVKAAKLLDVNIAEDLRGYWSTFNENPDVMRDQVEEAIKQRGETVEINEALASLRRANLRLNVGRKHRRTPTPGAPAMGGGSDNPV